MKKVIYSVLLALTSLNLKAQIAAPVESPSASFTQKFGLTEIKMEYSRPSVKNRKIFGNVVILDKIWRIGANGSTKFTTTDSLSVAGKGLSKGTYIMLAIPNNDEWTIIFNKNLDVSYENYKPEFNVLEVKIKPKKTAQFVETFGIQTNNITKTSCDLELAWENTLIQIPLQNEVHSKIMAEIKQKLGGPTKADFQTIAGYYYENNIDLKSALEYIDKGIAQGEGYGNLRIKSLILAKMGDKKGAIEWAEKSLARAKKFDNADYIRMNEESIAEWKKAK
jgi:Protein of unknown function (DUF2911)